MVGDQKIYQGQVVQVVYQVNGDEFVIQFADGSRKPVSVRDLTDVPKPASNRPIITKGFESGPGTGGAELPEPDDKIEKPEAPIVPLAPPAGDELTGADVSALKTSVEKDSGILRENTIPASVVEGPVAPIVAEEPPPAVPEQPAPAQPEAVEPPPAAPELPF